MGNKERDAGWSYFELQAYVGTTKHMGGQETTRTLIEACHVDQDAYVLDVGSGAGATACYLAQTYGCRVVGVDLRDTMVELAEARAVQEEVAALTEFRVADARNLPFEAATFDVVLCESVATFVEDKAQVAREFARVTKPEGYVGLNEEIWLKPPPPDLSTYAKTTWAMESDIPTLDEWVTILEAAGLRDIDATQYTYNIRRESTQVKRYRLRDLVRMLWRAVKLYVTDPDFRAYMKERQRPPKHLFDYLGYALFVCRGPS